MKPIKKKLGVLLLCMASVFAFAVPAMAKDLTEKKEVNTSLQSIERSIKDQNTQLLTNDAFAGFASGLDNNFAEMGKYSSNSLYLLEDSPRENAVIKQGSKLYIKFYARDTWKYYYTKPIISIFDSNSNIVYSNFNQDLVSLSGQVSYSGYISWNTATAKPGKYSLYIVNAPCRSNGELLSNWTSFDTPYIITKFTLAANSTHKHTYGAWKTVKAATVFSTGKRESTCKSCGQKKSQTIAKLKPTIKLSATKKTLGRNKSYTLSITGLAKGDAVKSVYSNKTAIATVNKAKTNQYKITGKKKGTATVTVVLKSGKKATCTVTVK